MEYMESKMQDQCDSFDARAGALSPFIDDLIKACNKHGVDNGDIAFVARLFEIKYIPPL